MNHTTTISEYMQFDTADEHESHFRIIGYSDPERRVLENRIHALPPDKNSSPLNIPHKHQRVQTLILSARQVQDQGGLPGLTPPFLPKGPSLVRKTPEEEEDQPDTRLAFLRSKGLATYDTPATRNPQIVIKYSTDPDFKPSVMPHAVSMPNTGFQALILCGPGVGLSTFTSVPQEYPKALVPVANRPMIWYVLDWCYRMGVSNITIITPPSSKPPIEAALAQNPDLTTLPSPKPDLIAPADLEFNTPTAELLRLPEVQDVIKNDFLLLPCDLICDIAGDAFLESYLTSMGALTGTDSTNSVKSTTKVTSNFPLGAEGSGRRGGLSIWYNTANREESVKKEECDFMGIVDLESSHEAPLDKIAGLPDGRLRKLVYTIPMSELLEEAEENKSWKVRQSLLRRYGKVKCMTQYRDSHIYFLPHWIKRFAAENEDFESFSEDLIGKWAQSEWRKPSYRTQLGATKIFQQQSISTSTDNGSPSRAEQPIEDEIDLLSLSSTQVTQQAPRATNISSSEAKVQLASRVQADDNVLSSKNSNANDDYFNQHTDLEDPLQLSASSIPYLPPILSYILPSTPSAPLVRRVDTTPLLLSVSLLLAKLPSHEQANSTPLSHQSKIHATSQPPQGIRVSISQPDSLIGPNVALSAHIVIKASCIGSNCTIGGGARITGCVIMDGAQIGDKAVLTGCVVGKKAMIGKNAQLRDCEVQDGFVVKDGTEAKNEKYLIGGFEGDEDDMDFGGDGEEQEEDDD